MLASLAGCAGPTAGGDGAACDEPLVTETLHHFLGESQMGLVAVDDLQCSGDWSWARALVAGLATSDTSGGTESPMSVG